MRSSECVSSHRQLSDLYPPNQILSPKYTPDSIAIIRPLAQQRTNNISFIPPRPIPSAIKHYVSHFSPCDTLGYHYAKYAQHFVYLKYDNSAFNRSPNQSISPHRVMGAMYVPLQLLSDISHFTPVYRGIKQLNMQHQYGLVFNQGYGYAFDPKFTSNYQGGNLLAAIRIQPYTYDLILHNDINSQSQNNWFHFAIKFTQQGDYTITIANMSTKIPPNCKILYKRVYQDPKTNTTWLPIPQPMRTQESKILQQNQPNKPYYRLSFTFRCKNRNQMYMFCSKYPYVNLDAECFLRRVIEKKLRLMIVLQHYSIGESFLNHPINCYLIRRRRRENNIKYKTYNVRKSQQQHLNQSQVNSIVVDSVERSIVVLARQNPSCTEGNYIIQGIMEYLLENLQSEVMKKVFRFYFVPCINPDGVKHGSSENNMVGQDLGKWWDAPNPQHHPQIHAVHNHLQQIEKQAPILMLMNIESSSEPLSSIVGKNDRLFPYFCAKRNNNVVYRNVVPATESIFQLEDQFQSMAVFEMRVGTFMMGDDGECGQHTIDSLKRFGKDIICLFLQYVKLMEKNTMLQSKWRKEIEQCPLIVEDELSQDRRIAIEKRLEKQFICINGYCGARTNNRHKTYRIAKKQFKHIQNSNNNEKKEKNSEKIIEKHSSKTIKKGSNKSIENISSKIIQKIIQKKIDNIIEEQTDTKQKQNQKQKQNMEKQKQSMEKQIIQNKKNQEDRQQMGLARVHLRFTVKKRTSKMQHKKSLLFNNLFDRQ